MYQYLLNTCLVQQDIYQYIVDPFSYANVECGKITAKAVQPREETSGRGWRDIGRFCLGSSAAAGTLVSAVLPTTTTRPGYGFYLLSAV